MHITASQIQMTSAYTSTMQDVETESLHVWRDGHQPSALDNEQAPAWGLRRMAEAMAAQAPTAQVDLSAEAAALQPTKAVLEPGAQAEEPQTEMEVSLLKALVERLTGREIKLLRPQDLQPQTEPAAVEDPKVARNSREGWGLVYDHYQSHYESESVSFQAQGVVQTADGQQIEISVDLNMSREFFSDQRLSVRAGDALKDPLVINFGGTAAELTQRSFSFDLDSDGQSEQIAFVKSGSGFLALDRNGDGMVNDGSELFGPASGDGFAELAAFDEDGNNWIDEADSIYERLRIWSKDAQGNDTLVGLGQRDVGAIYLGRIDTPFALKDVANQQLGQVAGTGLFLGEEGGAGTVQQVDLVV